MAAEKETSTEPTSFRFTSNGLWHAPGMIRNYQWARSVEDAFFTDLMEEGYPSVPQSAWDKIASGDYEVKDDTVIVEVCDDRG